jgi:hypothetical protein
LWVIFINVFVRRHIMPWFTKAGTWVDSKLASTGKFIKAKSPAVKGALKTAAEYSAAAVAGPVLAVISLHKSKKEPAKN